MTELFDYLETALGTSRRGVVLRLVVVAAAVAFGVVVATRLGLLPIALFGSIGILGFLASLRWPVVALFAFVALIPVEEVIQIQGFGTLSRFAAIMFAVAYAIPRLGRIQLKAMPLPGWAWIGWAILSAGWALDRTVAIAALGTVVQLFGIAVLVADFVAHRPQIVRPLLWVYSVFAAITSLVGILAYVNGSFGSGERVAAFADQDVAQFAAILLPAFVFAVFQLVEGRAVLASATISFVTLAGILLSGTRGAWLGAGLVLLFVILPRLEPRRRVGALGAVALLLVLALQLPGVADLVSQRTELAVPTGGAGRTEIWAVGISIFESSPAAGVGYGNYIVAYTPERIRDSAIGQTASEPDARAGSHSIIFGTLAELGIVGLVLLALFIVPLVLKSGWGPDAPVVRAMLVAILTSALFLDVLNRKQVWLVIGMAAGLAFVEVLRGVEDRRPLVQVAPRHQRVIRGPSRLGEPRPAARRALEGPGMPTTGTSG
jgi:O-antigen ligase